MGWIVALPALGLLYVINKRFKSKGKGKSKKVFSVAAMVVAAVAGVGLVYTFAGSWFASLVGWVGSAMSAVTGESGWQVAIPITVTIIALGVVAGDIAYDRKADKGAQVAAMVLPTLVAQVVGGVLGAEGGDAVAVVHAQVAQFLSTVGGS